MQRGLPGLGGPVEHPPHDSRRGGPRPVDDFARLLAQVNSLGRMTAGGR
jgi:hypothetical protein